MHQRDRFAFSEISPPARGNCPQTKTNLAHRQIRIFVSPETHCQTLANEVDNVQYPTPKVFASRRRTTNIDPIKQPGWFSFPPHCSLVIEPCGRIKGLQDAAGGRRIRLLDRVLS